MRWVVFKDAMRFSMQMTLIWGIGLGAVMTLSVLMTPSLQGLDLISLFETLPPAMLGAMGVGEDLSSLNTPEGLIAFAVFSKMALIFAAYPVVIGLRVTANEEDEGILDMTLTQPVPRAQFLLERFLAYVVNIAVLMILVIVGLFVGIWAVDMDLNAAKLVVMTLNLIPVMVVVLAVTVFVSSVISRKRTVLTIMTAFIMVSYVVQTVGAMVATRWMDAVEAFSFFSYYNVETMLREGVVPTDVLLLTAVSIGLIAASLRLFEQRDIA
ncbi:MAG: ABC transporter permease subunit [Anaerolineae bacterium]|nr:ABC transporter permease subunit [Anaerolineae bacterium]